MACDLTIGNTEEGVDALLVPGEREEEERRGRGGEKGRQNRVMVVSVSD